MPINDDRISVIVAGPGRGAMRSVTRAFACVILTPLSSGSCCGTESGAREQRSRFEMTRWVAATAVGGIRMKSWVLGAVLVVFLGGVTSTATAQAPIMRVASTSGVPHVDVADYRRSPMWRPGMPRGANSHWRAFMRTSVRRITDNADTVLHTGDQVQGRWHRNKTRHKVFGPMRTSRQRKQAITRAGNTIYPWLNQFWPARTIWAQGDHEIGDMLSSGIIPRRDFQYRAHRRFNDVWKRHHGGRTFYQRDVGPVTVITLDPLVQWRRGILPRVATSQVRRMSRWIDRAKAEGDWVVVQSEIPATGPNARSGTSALILENGPRVLNAAADADLFLAAEFHTPTVIATDQGPVHIVHGGNYKHVDWMTVDIYDDELQLTLRSSQTRLLGSGEIWSPVGPRANTRPEPGPVRTVGSAVLDRDGFYEGEGQLAARGA